MPEPTVKTQLVSDHAELYDTLVARRYFAKFDRITGHLARVAAELESEGGLTRLEARLIGGYIGKVAATIADRSITIGMERKAPGQAVARMAPIGTTGSACWRARRVKYC